MSMTRTLVWLRWGITVGSFALIAGGAVLLSQSADVPQPTLFAFRGFDATASVCYLAVAWLILVGRPLNGIGWFLLVVGFLSAVTWFVSQYAAAANLGDVSLKGGAYAAWLQIWLWVPITVPLLGLLPTLYPHGRIQSRLGKAVAIGVFPAMVLLVVGDATQPGELKEPSSYAQNPLAISGIPHDLILGLGGLSMLTLGVGGAWTLIRKFGQGSEIERLQIKWLLSALVFLILLFLTGPLWWLVGGEDAIDTLEVFLGLGFLAIPISMGIAVTRYRLYEIDVVINRAVVYSPLTAAVAASYVASVQVAKVLFVAVTGERSQSELLMATVIAAAVFWMIRTRMIGLVDRHFKDPREPAKDLRLLRERIATTTRFMEPRAISGERVARHVLETVVASYGAVGGTLHLTGAGAPGTPLVVGDGGHAQALALDLSHEGNVHGRLVLGPRPGAKPYGERDQEPLSATAAALAEVLSHRPVTGEAVAKPARRTPTPRRRQG